MQILETPEYSKMGYIWGNNPRRCFDYHQESKAAQGLTKLFEAWCSWSKMDIRIDKCTSFGMSIGQTNYQQMLPRIALEKRG
jgi:hypothetical protein